MASQVSLWLAALLVWPAILGHAEPSAESLRACVEANFPERSSLQHIALHSVDRAGSNSEIVGMVFQGAMNSSPISDVESSHSANSASGGCQKKRPSPVRFSSCAMPTAQSSPATIARNSGGK